MAIVTYTCQDNNVRLILEGRVDTACAEDTEKEMLSVLEANPHDSVTVDAEKLEYVSSAGLRVFLRLKKKESSLALTNVCPDVYDVFEMTGFTEIMSVEKAFQQLSVEGCDVIGEGAKGVVYRYNHDTIVKVYKSVDALADIRREKSLAKKAFVLGVPTAIAYGIVKVGDKYGSMFELLDSKSLSEMIKEDPENLEKYVKISAELLKIIHSTIVQPDDMPDVKIKVNKQISSWPFEDGVKEKLSALVAAVPDTLNMLHCDYHTNNIMMQGGEALLIDMDTLSHGHPVFELANIFIGFVGFGVINKGMVEKFIGLPYEVCCKFWELFIKEYLGEEKIGQLDEIEKKIEILAYLRMMHHYVRRGIETDEQKQIVEFCRKKVPELLAEVDSLDF